MTILGLLFGTPVAAVITCTSVFALWIFASNRVLKRI